MIGRPRPGRYRLHGLDSPEGGALLAEQGVTRADLDRALQELERREGIGIRSIVGINDDGVFGTGVEGWRPDLPDACKETFVPLLWLKILELLGRGPEGSTARFIQDGTLPDCSTSGPTPPRPPARRRSRFNLPCRTPRRYALKRLHSSHRSRS